MPRKRARVGTLEGEREAPSEPRTAATAREEAAAREVAAARDNAATTTSPAGSKLNGELDGGGRRADTLEHADNDRARDGPARAATEADGAAGAAADAPASAASPAAATPGDTPAPGPRLSRTLSNTTFVRPTSADAFFLSNTHRRNFASRKLGRDILRGTSGKRISERLGPLDLGALPRVAREAGQAGPPCAPARTAHSQAALALHCSPERLRMLTAQLLHGSHVVLHGVGDKQAVVRELVHSAARAHRGAGVLVPGATGRALNADRLLDAVEAALLVHRPLDPPLPAGAELPTSRVSRVAQRLRRIVRTVEHAAAQNDTTHPHRLFLGLLAFDSPLLHTTRLHTVVHALARCARVHVVAAVSHMHAPLLLDGASGGFAHGVSGNTEEAAPAPLAPLRGAGGGSAPGVRDVRASWVWHNASTYVPPVAEMLHSRGVTISSSASASLMLSGLAALRLPAAVDLAGGRLRAQANASRTSAAALEPISQTVAVQVLNTITTRARTLFAQLAYQQLDALGAEGGEYDARTTPRTGYSALVREALQQFTATSEEGVRQLLGEMVDHGLVVAARGNATVGSAHAIAPGDELSIPLGTEALQEVLDGLYTAETIA